MLLKRILAIMLLLVVAVIGWRVVRSGAVDELLAPQPVRAPAVKFDNGTVRQYGPASSPGPMQVAPGPSGVHKCVSGERVTYTDRECPAGHREQAVVNGTVTVVRGEAHPAPPPETPAPAPRKTIRDVLSVPEGESIRDKRIEQAR
jgi:hypothetical protein